jgi:hypothetical protein
MRPCGMLPAHVGAHMTRTFCSFALVLAGASLACACSSSDNTPAPAPATTVDTPPAQRPAPPEPTADPTPPPPPFTASFPKVESRGGAVIAAPHIVPVVFAGDPMLSDITNFTSKLAGSKFWTDTATEYGVGALTASAPVVLNETPAASLTSAQIETWLATELSGASPPLGQPDASTLYAVFYPSGVTITMDGAGEMGQSCQGYGGYHYEITAGGKSVGYAVLPRCAGIDDLTVATAHEAFEWATDPFPTTAPAFAKLDDPHWAWQAAMIGELGDLCTFLDPDYPSPPEIGYSVQRFWSNKLSLAGNFPCGPKKPVAYIQAIATADDDAIVPDYAAHAGTLTTKAIRVKPGQSRTVDVHIYTDDMSSRPVYVYAQNIEELYQKPSTSGFTYSIPTTPAAMGSVLKLTVNAPTQQSMDVLMMMSVTSDRTATYWPVLIVNDDAASALAGNPSVTPTMLPRLALARAASLGHGPRLTRLGIPRNRTAY